ncbi:MAG: hypothetical protein LBP51_00825 [Deferribacteraceae bacterium]|jgi:hypothetical protein|nr:hypothetical protein [Deferribacteraceae bacterium]
MNGEDSYKSNYFVNWHISFSPEGSSELRVGYPTLEDAKAGAEEVFRAYTQKDIDIEDAAGNIILKAEWHPLPLTESERKELPILFDDGNAGWYLGWIETS